MTTPALTNYVPTSPRAVKDSPTGRYLRRELGSAATSILQANDAITSNAANITSNAASITTVQGNITTLQGQVTTLQSQVVANASSQKQISAPVAPASTSAFKMQGLAGSITPAITGKVLILISGTVVSPLGTSADVGIAYQISYGTGGAPSNTGALTGTQVGSVQTFTLSAAASSAADVNTPFSTNAVVTGLTIGTPYWVDLAAESVSAGSTIGLANISISVIEL